VERNVAARGRRSGGPQPKEQNMAAPVIHTCRAAETGLDVNSCLVEVV